MKRGFLISLLLGGACGAGVACGFLVSGLIAGRDAVGLLLGRGHLLAVAGGEGIYVTDVQRAIAELRYARGADDQNRPETLPDERSILRRLVSHAVAREFSAQEIVSTAEIDRELDLLRRQFRDEKTWSGALRASGLSDRCLQRILSDDLRARHWIFEQIASRVLVTEEECRRFYDAHQENFLEPAHLRASHLFLAAPPEAPLDVVDAKRAAIESLSARLANGENFADLVEEASEDEATKIHSGDLGYFTPSRMPADFYYEALKLGVGQISQPVRTRLGFHIIQLTDIKPGRQIPFEEARGDIAAALEDQKRLVALEALDVDLCARAEWLRQPL